MAKLNGFQEMFDFNNDGKLSTLEDLAMFGAEVVGCFVAAAAFVLLATRGMKRGATSGDALSIALTGEPIRR